jgi:hypothetical protein
VPEQVTALLQASITVPHLPSQAVGSEQPQTWSPPPPHHWGLRQSGPQDRVFPQLSVTSPQFFP